MSKEKTNIPPQAESPSHKTEKATKKASDVKGTVMYIGPTIPKVATSNSIYSNGVPDGLAEKIKEIPSLSALVVPVERLAAAQRDMKNRQSAVGICYAQALAALKKGGKE